MLDYYTLTKPHFVNIKIIYLSVATKYKHLTNNLQKNLKITKIRIDYTHAFYINPNRKVQSLPIFPIIKNNHQKI